MKHSLQFISTLLALVLPIAAHADCDRYMNSTLTLNLPDTITVPADLPIGGEIISRAFSGTAPAFFAVCRDAHLRITGRFLNMPPVPPFHRTEAPGVGARLRITSAGGFTNFFGMHTQPGAPSSGTAPSLTAAELKLYKIAPVADGVVPAGEIWSAKRDGRPDGFTLRLGNSVRFVTPGATCDLATGDVNRTISLDPIKVSALQNATYIGERQFELTAHCTNASNVTFRFSGTPAPGHEALFANTGTARGVDVWLYSRIGGGIQNIGANGDNNTRTVVVDGNRAVLPLGAAYHKNGTVTPGTLVSTATVNITYN
ncbi:fimbrial protein [Pseudomonas sp. PB105]|uniref:fimbrial protein n=1 Tax=unclassified Pseudomonas TaxID=196821 RepID=UPI00131C77D8|nr:MULTISPECIES: fimbrial protein [unclassified Pseudomonas]KAE9650295.1 fimbrial protein [Pseudomonas sp. PB105]MVW94460.1 fimbrial protein [Pseudomonas sp. PB100]